MKHATKRFPVAKTLPAARTVLAYVKLEKRKQKTTGAPEEASQS